MVHNFPEEEHVEDFLVFFLLNLVFPVPAKPESTPRLQNTKQNKN